MKLLSLAKKHNYICWWCKKKFSIEDLSRDHIYPKKHPMRSINRQQGNMVLACIFCNQERGNLPFEVFEHKEVKVEKKYISPYYDLEEMIKPSRLRGI